MALKLKRTFSEEEIRAGIAMVCDPGGFARGIMRQRLVIPPTRIDLPDHFQGKTILTHEQRLMIYDGATYALLRWRRPKQAKGSNAIIFRTSRKTAKTTFGIELRWAWWSVINPYGRETAGLLHTPNQSHLAPVEGRLEQMIWSSPLLRIMHSGSNKADGIWKWKTGMVWYHRIEGMREDRAGQSMIGLAVEYMIGDEGAYGRHGPWRERLAVRLPGCLEVWGGVPRAGETGPFKEIVTRERALKKAGKRGNWSVHAQPDDSSWQFPVYDMRANPLYHSQPEFSRQVGESWDSEETLTQVLGLDSEGGRTAFPVIATAPIPFQLINLQPSDISSGAVSDIIASLGFGNIDSLEWGIFCDYGHSPSPLEMILAYKAGKVWYEHTRIEAWRLDTHDAARLVAICDQLFPVLASRIVLDIHGQGRGLYDTLAKHPDYLHLNYESRVRAASFETFMDDERVLVHKKCKQAVRPDEDKTTSYYTCEACGLTDLILGKRKPDGTWDGDLAPMRVQAKELLTGDLVDALQIGGKFLNGKSSEEDGWGLVLSLLDTDLIEELRGTVALEKGSKTVIFQSASGNNHMTDALRCIAQGERTGPTILLQPVPSWLDEAGFRNRR